MESTVLTVEQLAQRWQISKSKIYADNAAGKLPHLSIDRNKFPIESIETMENETKFDRNDIHTPIERKLKRNIEEQQRLLKLKDKQILELKANIARAHAFLTKTIYEDIKEA